MAKSIRLSDMGDALVAAHMRELLRHIITLAHNKNSDRPSSRALLGFVVRNAGSWKTLNALVGHCENEDAFKAVAIDCGAVVRCMYDAYIQALYVIHDPNDCDRRGELYLEYEHVERYRQMQKLIGQDNELSEYLHNSPLREIGEVRIQQEYDRVKGNYSSGRRDGVRNHWYPQHLRAIAEEVGRQDEFDWFVAGFHGSVHSGPLTVFHGPALPGAGVLYIAISIAARTAMLLAKHEDLDLDQDALGLLQGFDTPLVDGREGAKSERQDATRGVQGRPGL